MANVANNLAFALTGATLANDAKFFDGGSDGPTPEEFLQEIQSEMLFLFGPRPVMPVGANNQQQAQIQPEIDTWDTRHLGLLHTNLKGAAKQWLGTLPPNIRNNLVQLTNAFRTRFMTDRRKYVERSKEANLYRLCNESIRDFAARVTKNTEIAWPDPNAPPPQGVNQQQQDQLNHNAGEAIRRGKQIEIFIKGLQNQFLKRSAHKFIINNPNVTFQGLIDHIEQRDIMEALSKENEEPSQAQTNIENQIQQLTNQIQSLTASNTQYITEVRGQMSNRNTVRRASSVPRYRNTERNRNFVRTWNNNRKYFRPRSFSGPRGNSRERNPYPERRSNQDNRYDPNNPRFRQNRTRFCKYCRKSGHTLQFCFQKKENDANKAKHYQNQGQSQVKNKIRVNQVGRHTTTSQFPPGITDYPRLDKESLN